MSTVNEKMTALADAIREKSGVTTPLSLDAMKNAVDIIQTGIDGLVEEGSGQYSVILVDTDGTILKRIWGNPGDIIKIPEKPDRDRSNEHLSFYNWCSCYEFGIDDETGLYTITLEYEHVVVGATWGLNYEHCCMELDILPCSETIAINMDVFYGGPISIDWGDGTIEEYPCEEDDLYSFSHLYNTSRETTIKIMNLTGSEIFIEGIISGQNYIKKIRVGGYKYDTPSYPYLFINHLMDIDSNSLEEINICNCDLETVFLERSSFPSLKAIFLNDSVVLTTQFGWNDFWFQTPSLEYFIIDYNTQIDNNEGYLYMYNLENSNVKYLNKHFLFEYSECCWNMNNLTSIRIKDHSPDDCLVGCQNLKEIRFCGTRYGGGLGFCNTPNLERVIFEEGVKYCGFSIVNMGSHEQNLPSGIKYVDCPSTIESYTIVDGNSLDNSFMPNLQIIDLSKAERVVSPLWPEATDTDYNYYVDWEPHPTVKIIVHKDYLQGYLADPIWSKFGNRIIT